jgi:5-methylcytosine-specific restriction enzyme subunit McrC
VNSDSEYHTLDELDRQGVLVSCDEQTAAALHRSKLVSARREPGGQWRLLPRERVGAVRVGDVEVNVRPKVGIARLLFMLGYAHNPNFQAEDISAVPEVGLWPALAESLARQAEAALMRGVLQGYTTIDDTLPLVRGRIRVGDQITRRPGMLLPLELRYDDFTVDIAENQILKSALQRMLAVPSVRPDAAARLSHLLSKLTGVTSVSLGAPLPPWRPTRINARYRSVLQLAGLILRHLSLEPGAGGHFMVGFVISMATVFEQFVCTALALALRSRPGRAVPHHCSTLDLPTSDGASPLKIDIDLVHLLGNRPAIAFDAKYKLASRSGGYPNADQYQMLAYCTALGVHTGWLIYAQGARPVTERVIRNSTVRIIEYPLDLEADPLDLLQQIQRLADLAWTILSRGPR